MLKRLFAVLPENGPVHFLRIFTLAAMLVLGFRALVLNGDYVEDQRLLNLSVEPGEEALAEGTLTPLWLVIVYGISTAIAGVGFVLSLITGTRRSGQILALILTCAAMAVAWLLSDLHASVDALGVSRVGENPAPWTYFVQLLLTTLLMLSPPLLLILYYRSSLMDQYLVRAVVTPVVFCFIGFIAIWLIIDLTDNGRAFISSGSGLGLLAYYYLVQLPQMIMLVLPITILLSLLYSLGQMSRSNEIISMLGSGRSLLRVLRPVTFAGLYFSFVCTVLNYEWAPQAEARRQGIIDRLEEVANDRGKKESRKRRQRDEYASQGWMYRNSLDGRTWFVGRVPVDLADDPMEFVAIWWQWDNDQVFRSYRADKAYWNHETQVWTLRKVKIWAYDEFGTASITYLPVHEVPDWRETPWHVVSSSYNAEYLGVPQLTTYLRTNAALPDHKLAPYRTQWWYSFAEPLRCFFIVLMAAPLGVVHSRRGVLGGVAASIGIFFSLMFFDSLFLGLGQGGRMPAVLGAWIPNLVLAALGALLLYQRSENKEMPKLRFWAKA